MDILTSPTFDFIKKQLMFSRWVDNEHILILDYSNPT
jgi:hypothetical protein